MRLRPEGKSALMLAHLDAARQYYGPGGRAQTWEMQTLIKARCVAGDTALADEFLALVEPQVPVDNADLAEPARVALAALDEVIRAFGTASAEGAKRACRCETELDRHYREALGQALRLLAGPRADPAFVITHLFVAKYLERIGARVVGKIASVAYDPHLVAVAPTWPPAGVA